MRKKIKVFFIFTIFSIIFYFIFKNKDLFINVFDDKSKIVIYLSTAGLGDNSFNDSAYKGIQQAKSSYENFNISYFVPKSSNDLEPMFKRVGNNFLSIFIGFEWGNVVCNVQEDNKSHYVLIDDVVNNSNVTSIEFREDEASFFAGIAAALLTEKKKVAFIGAVKNPVIIKFLEGFESGINEIVERNELENIEVMVWYIGGQNPFSDIQKGRFITEKAAEAGCDIIFHATAKSCSNFSNLNGVKYIIGCDSTSQFDLSKKVIGVVVKNIDKVIMDVIDGKIKNTLLKEKKSVGYDDGAVDFLFEEELIDETVVEIIKGYMKQKN